MSKPFSKELTFSYWWACEKIKGEIPKKLQEALDESAEERMFEMRKQGYGSDGYVSGELHDNVNMDLPGLRTPEDGWECHGWWELNIQETES